MARDVEDLIFQTLRVVVSEDTGIPSGRVYLKRPAEEFVVQQNGPNAPIDNSGDFPAIGINVFKDSIFNPNNYGSSFIRLNNDNTTTKYSPLAEIEMMIGISLFTTSRKDQRDFGTKLYMSILNHPFITLLNDPVPGEYAGLKLVVEREVPDTKPYHKIYVVRACSRILREVTAPTVFTIDTGIGLAPGQADEIQTDPFFTTSSSGTTWQ